jgi:Flp pilus assembly protein TadD
VELGRTDEAEASYLRCIALDPRGAAGHNNLAVLYKRLGRTDAAIRELALVVQHHPGAAGSSHALGLH